MRFGDMGDGRSLESWAMVIALRAGLLIPFVLLIADSVLAMGYYVQPAPRPKRRPIYNDKG
jgi:hypothetical protein